MLKKKIEIIILYLCAIKKARIQKVLCKGLYSKSTSDQGLKTNAIFYLLTVGCHAATTYGLHI